MKQTPLLAAIMAALDPKSAEIGERKFSCSIATLFPQITWARSTTCRARNRRRKEKRRLAALKQR